MKISILIKREPFLSIFESSIEAFLADYYKAAHTVNWNRVKRSVNTSESKQIWYCNPLINSIFVRKVNKKVFESINGEYASNPLKPWRSFMQAAYLKIAQSRMFGHIIASHSLEIFPPLPNADCMLIIGGNTKLRLIDISKKSIFVILKHGFDIQYIQREVFVRNEFPHLPVTPIAEVNLEHGWYQEQYITGHPPNRLQKARGKIALERAIQAIHVMLIESERRVSLSDYVELLFQRWIAAAAELDYVNEKAMTGIRRLVRILKSTLESSEVCQISIAYCHGDFHQGNILANDEDMWIMDWEYSGEKQIAYDLFVLLIQSRVESGYASRVTTLLTGSADLEYEGYAQAWPGIDWYGSERFVYLLLFLFEEVNFYISELSCLVFYQYPDCLDARAKEFSAIADFLVAAGCSVEGCEE